ncbi:MAG: hypothetical protein PVF51_01520 [Nitrospirota bacterium]|jgi:hypothetical protein
MRPLSSSVALALAVAVSGTVGCQSLPGKHIDRAMYGENLSGTFTHPGFDDIELPRGLTFQTKLSTILDSEDLAYGELHFKGRLKGLAVADFLTSHMPRHGWQQMSRVHLENYVLFFEKESRLCMATVEDGPIITRLVLLVMPRSTPQATTMPAPLATEEQPTDELDTVPLFPEDDPWK